MTRAFIGVGSNIAPESNIREALRRLAQSMPVTAISTFYRQPAIGRPEEPPFYNGIVVTDTDLPPARIKSEVLRPIEADLGRHRGEDKYASRPIDLDLLLCGDCVLSNNDLRLPHPDILKRAFVAIPLCELAPALVLPGYGLRIRDIAQQFATEGMEPLHHYTRELQQELLGS